MTGSADEIAAIIAAFRAQGSNEIQVRLFPNDLATIERFGGIVERVRSAEQASR